MPVIIDRSAPSEMYCPIAGTVMSAPMKMPCCKQNIDQASVNALLARLPFEKKTIPCPLCRKRINVISQENGGVATESNGSKVVSRKIVGLVRDKPLKKRVEAWVSSNSEERRGLLCKPEDFPDPATLRHQASEQIFIDTRGPPGGLQQVLERSRRIVPQPKIVFGPSFHPKFQDFASDQVLKRDFLVIFNEIWRQIPTAKRPPAFQADVMSDFYLQVRDWLQEEEAKVALATVTSLNLHDLELASFPIDPKLLPSLAYLDVSENSLESIPRFPKLRWLNARQNKVQSIGEEVASMPKLEYLLLGKNPITGMHAALAKSRSLLEIEFSGYMLHHGIPSEFATFAGKLSCPRDDLDGLMVFILQQIEEIVSASRELEKCNLKEMNRIFEILPPVFREQLRKAILENIKNLGPNPEMGKMQRLYADTLFLIGLNYISWLYRHDYPEYGQQCFLRFSENIRKAVYYSIYKKAGQEFSGKKSDPDFGEKAFFGLKDYEIDNTLRLQVLTEVIGAKA